MKESLKNLTEQWLDAIGEDVNREGLVKTPERVATAWQYLVQGYTQKVEDVIGNGIFESVGSEMVVIKNIEFYSMCEHHMLPFFGTAHIGYIPNGKILGLSKFARIVDMFARRLQVQERMTIEIANVINDLLKPRGVGVILQGTHLCMAMRGVEKQKSSTLTTCMLGIFEENIDKKREFLSMVPNLNH